MDEFQEPTEAILGTDDSDVPALGDHGLEDDVAGQQPVPEAGAPDTGDFDPKSWEMTYQGNKVIPKDRQHLINLAQQGYGYSKGMEGLKRDRAEIDAQRQNLSKYDTLDQALTQNPQLAQNIWGLVQQQMQGGVQQSPEGSQDEQQQMQLPPEVMQKMQDFDKFRQTYDAKQADESLTREIDDLKKQYPNDPWNVDDGSGTLQERVINHALQNNIMDIGVAYKDLMWPQMEARIKADTLKAQAESQKANKRKGVVDNGIPGQKAPATKTGYKSGDSYNDLVERAVQTI